MIPRFGCAILASLLVCACGPGKPAPVSTEIGAAKTPMPHAAASPPVIAAPEEAPPTDPPAPVSPAGKSADTGEAAPRLAMRPVNKLAPPDPGRLIGMDRDGVAGLLGPPAFRRSDDPALVWQYRSAACILDVFLYREGPAYAVAHFEVRGLSVVEVDQGACFHGLLRDRAKSG